MEAQNISDDHLPAFCLNSWDFVIFSKVLDFVWTSLIALPLLLTNTSSHIDKQYSFYAFLNFFLNFPLSNHTLRQQSEWID